MTGDGDDGDDVGTATHDMEAGAAMGQPGVGVHMGCWAHGWTRRVRGEDGVGRRALLFRRMEDIQRQT